MRKVRGDGYASHKLRIQTSQRGFSVGIVERRDTLPEVAGKGNGSIVTDAGKDVTLKDVPRMLGKRGGESVERIDVDSDSPRETRAPTGNPGRERLSTSAFEKSNAGSLGYLG